MPESAGGKKPTSKRTGTKKLERFTVEQVAAALRVSGGLKYVAAQKIGMTPSAMTCIFRRHPELNDVLDEVTEKTLDLAESKLVQKIRDGNLGAIIFYLKCKGKSRGYVERMESTGPDGGPVKLTVVYEPLKAGNGSAMPDPPAGVSESSAAG